MERKERKPIFLTEGDSLIIVGPDGTKVQITAPTTSRKATILTAGRISERETERVKWETNFGRIFRDFAFSYMTNAGYQVIGSGEAISSEISLTESRSLIFEALKKAKEIGFSNLQVRRMVNDHARSILSGETRMGEEPAIVRELKGEINLAINHIWLPKGPSLEKKE